MKTRRHAIGRFLPASRLELFLVISLTGFPLRAQQSSNAGASPEVAAEALFVEGRRLMELGRYDEACAKFRESQRLDSGVGTLMNLARCYKSSGRTASAWSTYRQAASLAAAGKQLARERVARSEAAALEEELAMLEVRVPTARAGDVSVMLDGTPMSAELLAVPTPVDPGLHELRAVRGERTVWSTSLQIGPRERSVISIPESALDANEGARTGGAHDGASSDSNEWSGLHTAAVVQGGVGLVAAGFGVAMLLSANSDDEKAEGQCFEDAVAGTSCFREGYDLRERAIEKKKLAAISFVVAGTAIVGGTVLWFSAPNPWASPQEQNRAEGWSIGVARSW